MKTNDLKVLTLWQPWASLFAHQLKRYETRPKPTSFRGRYLIHAAKSFNRICKDACNQEFFAEGLNSIGMNNFSDIPTGAIVGAFTIDNCLKIDEFYFEDENSRKNINPNRLTKREVAFGDWRHGRCAWVGSDFKTSDPIPYTNGQGYHVPFRGNPDDVQHLLATPPIQRCDWCDGWGYIPEIISIQNEKSGTFTICPAGCKPLISIK